MKIILICYSKRDVSLHVHLKDQFLDMQEREYLRIYTRHKIESKVTYTVFLGLPEIDHTGEIAGEKGKETCGYINFDKCLYQERENEMRRSTKNNCTAPYTPNNERICDDMEDIKTAQLIAMEKFEGHKTGSKSSINCPMNCKTLFNVNFGGISEIETTRNLSREEIGNISFQKEQKEDRKLYKNPNFRATFSPVIQKIEEHELYSFMNLIAESGTRTSNCFDCILLYFFCFS